MLKYCRFIFLCVFGVLLGDPLPPPYDSLKEVRPFVDHGWYSNAKQLQALIKKYHVKTVIEVGSWLGKSTIDLARNLPRDGKVYAVDHWNGSGEHQEGQPEWHPCLPYLYEQFLSNIIHAQLTDKVVPIRMRSLEAASFLSVQPDLVYLDASHDTESVYKDLCAWYPFVRERGILCGDDWTWDSVRTAIYQFAEENHLLVQANDNFWRLVN